jgi:hypothetical protein
MNHLCNFILSTFAEFLAKKKTIMQKHDEKSGTQVPPIDSGPFLDPLICDEIKQTMNRFYSCGFYMGDIKGVFWFFDKDIEQKHVQFVFNYMIFLMFLFNKIKPLKKSVEIVLVDYERKKEKPSTNEPFTRKHVNSGVTIEYDSNFSKIIVYRKEEMIKVLTHELIHCFNLDANIQPWEEESLTKRFCLSNTIKVNEAFTDAFACIINTIMYTILEDPYKIDDGSFNKRLKKNIEKESQFVQCQANKVLGYVKYDTKCTHANHEGTSAISYYVIKSLLVSKSDEFLGFLRKQQYMLTDIQGFIQFIIKKLDALDALGYSTSLPSCNKNKKYISTMRMTMLDIMDFYGHMKSI